MLNGPSGIRHSSLPSAVNATRPNDWKNANTRSPSVTGDGDAGPLTFSRRSALARGTSRRHSSLPLARSSASTSSLLPSAPVMKMRVSVRTGEEWPVGTAVFHTTFFSGPNSDGSPEVFEIPVPFGPRKRDQSVSLGANDKAAASITIASFMAGSQSPTGTSWCGNRSARRNRRRAERVIVELVFRDDLELRPGLHHAGDAVLADDVDAAVGEDRRRAVGPGTKPLPAVDLLAGARVEAEHDAAIVDHVDEPAVGDRRRHVGSVIERPEQVRAGDVAAAAGLQHQHRPLAARRDDQIAERHGRRDDPVIGVVGRIE